MYRHQVLREAELRDMTDGAERNKALGVWGAIGASGATVGLIAGGLLTRYAGWPYIFFLNVPVGAAALLLTPASCRRAGSPRRGGATTRSARSR
jgi:MFS family permease